MLQDSNSIADPFDWQCQPQAATLIDDLLQACLAASPAATRLRDQMFAQTGTRLTDWIDHIQVQRDPKTENRLLASGFQQNTTHAAQQFWQHSGGLLPTILLTDDATSRLGIKVESVEDFLSAHNLKESQTIEGPAGGRYRTSVFAAESGWQLVAVERHGFGGFAPPETSSEEIAAAQDVFARFNSRQRNLDTPAENFELLLQTIKQAQSQIHVDWVCDLFFAAEREYWQSRNKAARTQKSRQDRLGLGWANHDHHTYRSSRHYFGNLIEVLESLGMICRERFYAGQEAGWGAQVLEQHGCQIVVFADVDLLPEEVAGDFAHEALTEQDQLGTVGLWCALHGEAILQAGMHHLECQFDFDRARQQLSESGIETMPPFTDWPHLRQAFTEGERWDVSPKRIDSALHAGKISDAQAEQFRTAGAIGSHLEILQRNEGFKGFNQSGVSDIIRRTDPRKQ